MDKSEMYILEGHGKAVAGDRLVDPQADSAFCCWSVIPSCASVLTVEDALLDARQAPEKRLHTRFMIAYMPELHEGCTDRPLSVAGLSSRVRQRVDY